MKTVFKIIAIIGVLSFLGGLKNGVFFIFGLILAGVFGYFGWKPEKQNVNTENLKNDNAQQKVITEENKINNNLNSEEVTINDNKNSVYEESSDNELKIKIDHINRKLNLLESSFSAGLLSKQEFEKKKESLEKESYTYVNLLDEQVSKGKVILENKKLFDKLLELKSNELISKEEYDSKYKILLTSLLNDQEQSKSANANLIEENEKHVEIISGTKAKVILYSLVGIFVCIIFYQLFANLYPKTSSSKNMFEHNSSTINKSENKIAVRNEKSKTQSGENKDESAEKEEKVVSELDRIYLGTNLFHEGDGGTWGRATISKKGDNYWIIGRHKEANGDWITIDGKILNPSVESFTFSGKIIVFNPSGARWINESDYLKKDKSKIYGDTCIWEGQTESYKLFPGRKYWRLKGCDCDCDLYLNDIDIFHN